MKTTRLVVVLLLLSVYLVSSFADSDTAELYQLLPGRYPDAISMNEWLENLPDTPSGRAIVERLVAEIKNTTGLPIPDSVVIDALNDSNALLDYGAISISGLSDLWTGLNLLYWAGEIPDINSSTTRIPSPFVYPDDIATAPVNMTDWLPTLEPMGDNYYWGFPYLNTTSIDQARINVVMSLVFNQLSANTHLASTDPDFFIIQVKGQSFSRADDFLNQLMSTGYNVSTYLEWHAAQFFGIYSYDSNGDLMSVADPLFQYTGIWNKNHTIEVTFPAIHSQYMITVNNSGVSFSLVWYQGDSSYGFYPGDMYLITKWSGRATAWYRSGPTAVQAIQYMAVTQDVFIAAAESNELFDEGYGVTGVCDDSCGIIELIMENTTVMYPFFIQKQFVVPEIEKRIQMHDQYKPDYYNILAAVNRLEEDWSGINPTSIERAAAQIVWPVGEEPWQCVVDSRAILEELIGHPITPSTY